MTLREERAVMSLCGVAVGEIVGRAGGRHTPQSLRKTYGGWIKDLIDAKANKKYVRWKKGETSDDTALTIEIANSIVQTGTACRRDVMCNLREVPEIYWGYKSMLPVLQTLSSPDFYHTSGLKAGAPMRVTPIGMIHPPTELETLVYETVKCCIMTHGARASLGSAAAVVAAVSAAIENCSPAEVAHISLEASRQAQHYGFPDRLPDSTHQIEKAIQLSVEIDSTDFPSNLDRLYHLLQNEIGSKPLFRLEKSLQTDLDAEYVSDGLRQAFEPHAIRPSEIKIRTENSTWMVANSGKREPFQVRKEQDELNVYFMERDSSVEVVASAFAFVFAFQDAEKAILAATNYGADSDTTASIAGAIAAAMYPKTLPKRWISFMEQVNNHNLTALAQKLFALRGQNTSPRRCLGDLQWKDSLPIFNLHHTCPGCNGHRRWYQEQK